MESVEQLKFVPVEGGTTLTDIHGTCPKCGFNFNGPDVREHLLGEIRSMERFAGNSEEQLQEIASEIASNYGWTEQNPKTFSLVIGVELPGADDGIVMHQCPGCETTWDRFSKKEGQYEIVNEVLPQTDQAETPTDEQTDDQAD